MCGVFAIDEAILTVQTKHLTVFWGLTALALQANAVAVAQTTSVSTTRAVRVASTSDHNPGWKRRARQGVVVMKREGEELLPDGVLQPRDVRTLGLRPMRQGLLELHGWPSEPKAPRALDTTRLARALEQLCPPWIGKQYVDRYAASIVRHSQHFGVDPMLLGAVMYQQSRCQAGLRTTYGTGLTMINAPMYRRAFSGTAYRYGLQSGGRWTAHELDLSQYAFGEANLRNADANLYFAAAFLSVYEKQCPHIDAPFGAAPHRHFVSHYVWGDRVRGTGPEDRILLARRRLLEYYSATLPQPRMGELDGLELTVPLDGTPRVVSSEFGDERDGGARLHRGVDFLSEQGEPVRASAPGVVIEAGAQFRRRGHVNLDPASTRLIPAGRFGPQGLHVRIRHANGVETLYAHLVDYTVRAGQKVDRGQLLGYVGRTGMRESDAHLHFGVFQHGQAVDPETLFTGKAVFEHRETWGGRGGDDDDEPGDLFGNAQGSNRGRARGYSVPRAGRVRSANQPR